jgi:hypothetical protein
MDKLQRGTQKAIAVIKGVHPSTVSRKIAGGDIPTTVEGLRIQAAKQSQLPEGYINANNMGTTNGKH